MSISWKTLLKTYSGDRDISNSNTNNDSNDSNYFCDSSDSSYFSTLDNGSDRSDYSETSISDIEASNDSSNTNEISDRSYSGNCIFDSFNLSQVPLIQLCKEVTLAIFITRIRMHNRPYDITSVFKIIVRCHYHGKNRAQCLHYIMDIF